MANTIKTAFKLDILRESVVVRSSPLKEFRVSTTSEIYSDNTQIVGTSHELVAAGDVTDTACMIVENLHATATIEIGGDDTGAFVSWITIPPGSPPAILPLVSSLAATYLLSDTASTPIRVTLAKVAT